MKRTNELVGKRIRLERCCDVYTSLKPGAIGTVSSVDDAGTVHVNWDTGHQLGLIWSAGDRWTVIENA